MNHPLFASTGAAVKSLLEGATPALIKAEDDRAAALARAGTEIGVVDVFDPRALDPALTGVIVEIVRGQLLEDLDYRGQVTAMKVIC